MGLITNLESSCDISVLLCIAYSHKLTDLPWLHRLQALYSYASLDCITVFFPNHFYCCVLPYVYITTQVTVELKSPAMGILYSSCSL